ncbi:MAG: trehalase family glycosidase [Candidatus Saccharimonadales bacterium]|jgi:hypothetical protein
MAIDESKLLDEAKKVLAHNDRKKWTVPAGDLYPHQWLWDSCLISIGLRHLDIDRAQIELTSLLQGQWSNGMLPNIIFSSDDKYHRDRELWRSYVSPYSPDKVATSGVTQPPLLAEAVVRIGQKLKQPERRTWYRQMYQPLIEYHQWLYRERNPHNEGLIVLLHPYEGGLDNAPPWISELRKHNMPFWLTLVEKAHLGGIIGLARRDTQHTTLAQRMDNIEAAAYWASMHRLRRKAYNSEALFSRSLFTVEDLAFNCILIQANTRLAEIAKTIGQKLPDNLVQSIHKTESALEQLWDESTGQYYYRSFISHKLIEESTIATLLPLYAGSISKDRAKQLVELLNRPKQFATKWPVPSVPASSPYFNPFRYWQGPTWINTNWLIIEGLGLYGFSKEAASLRQKTLDLVAKSGFYEYYNPLTGEPAGAANFSWTAALIIDLLKD